MANSMRLHASCVAVEGQGVLLMGEPGAGKSDLALRLIDRGAKLVADDQVELLSHDGNILAASPPTIEGLIEVRGVGIFKMAAQKTSLILAVQLARQEWIDRLPYPEPYECLGLSLAQMRICAFEPSAPIKIEMAVAALQDDSMTVGAFKE